VELPIDVIATTIVTALLFVTLGAALALVTVSLRDPGTVPLAVSVALVILSLVTVAVLPVGMPPLAGVFLAVLGTALAVLGGNPVARRTLELADGGRTLEGPSGGILVELMAGQTSTDPESSGPTQEILRGGTTIGYLERLAVALTIVAGFPEGVAVVVALKGIGRFTELATPAARERFIVGTLASLLWAGAVVGIVRLAIW